MQKYIPFHQRLKYTVRKVKDDIDRFVHKLVLVDPAPPKYTEQLIRDLYNEESAKLLISYFRQRHVRWMTYSQVAKLKIDPFPTMYLMYHLNIKCPKLYVHTLAFLTGVVNSKQYLMYLDTINEQHYIVTDIAKNCHGIGSVCWKDTKSVVVKGDICSPAFRAILTIGTHVYEAV